MLVEGSPIGTVHAQQSVNYEVWCQRGLLGQVADLVARLGDVRVVVVLSDTHVAPLYANPIASELESAGMSVLRYAIKPHRTEKSLETAADLFRAMFQHGADRNAVVLNVGGGTVGDLGGFIAAVYLRGVRYVHIPTTLVSQADSGIGGKVNLNFGEHVNSLSVFCHPAAVWIDPDLLVTLSDAEYRSGLAEIVKYAVVLDPQLFALMQREAGPIVRREPWIVEQIIQRCVRQKCVIVSEDPGERGRFRFFNYGHEIGHAVEVAYGYEDLRHGEAVAIGMHAAAWLGARSGVTDASLAEQQRSLLASLGIAVAIPGDLRARFSRDELIQVVGRLLHKDKKRSHTRLVWVLPVTLGAAVCTEGMDLRLVAECLERIADGRE
jgi:3-dehydroquinate synthase